MEVKELFTNGHFEPSERGMIPIQSHGFAISAGCFEGIRGYWNEREQEIYLFRLREHFERLLQSCKILQISLPYTIDRLIEISIELIRRNSQRQNVYLQPWAYKDDRTTEAYSHDLIDHLILTVEPRENYIDTIGLSCGISSWWRIDNNAIPVQAKSVPARAISTYIKEDARSKCFDAAIVLTRDGHVSGGSAENIFLVINGQLVTPTPTNGILSGITRDTVIELAERELGRIPQERPIDRTELYTAEEIFLCGTDAQIAPVVQVDHRIIGNGQTGPITSALQKFYFEVVHGHHPCYAAKWCTPAYAGIPQYSKTAV